MLLFTLFGKCELIGDSIYLGSKHYLDHLRLHEVEIAIKVIQFSSALVYYLIGGRRIVFLLLRGLNLEMLLDYLRLLLW